MNTNIVVWVSLVVILALILFFTAANSVKTICNGREYIIYEECDTPVRSYKECAQFAHSKNMLIHQHLDVAGSCFVDARDNTVRFESDNVIIPISFFQVCDVPSKDKIGLSTVSEALYKDIRLRTIFLLWLLGALVALVGRHVDKLLMPMIFFVLAVVSDDAQLHTMLVVTGMCIFGFENTYHIVVDKSWFCGLLTIAYIITSVLYVKVLAQKRECDDRYALEYVTIFLMALSTSHILNKKEPRREVDDATHYQQLI